MKPGFALVITLMLMILLTVIAVGLLTLSSISLRVSTQGNAMATARSNARLALMLALGELQKNAGPDQCVTARADVLDANIANPRITGVWKSWEIKATAPPATSEYEKTARDAKFQGWLVSGTDPAKTAQIAYANESPSSPVTLWDKGTLGDKAPANNLVHASKVPLVASTGAKPGATAAAPTGAMAWAVLDEGVKARINTRYIDDAASTGMKTAQLGAGERPGVEFIPGLTGLERRFFKQGAAEERPVVEFMPGLKDLERKFFKQGAAESAVIDKGITRLNFALAGENLASGKGVREALMPLTHDFTTQSFGLFTDTARGGLKQDFQLLTNATSLPAVYSGKGVYVSRLGMTAATAPSDPAWASLQQFARLYQSTITNAGGTPLVKAQAPSGWTAATTSGTSTVGTTVNRTPPPGLVLLPTIAKVQMLISLIGRDLYNNLPLPSSGS
ncbi:MAG: pilus assembly PilX N-terminal domain-containing protein [Verrucomicrobia bacterium]|nr:pilus assembly PilX N-terminal domain-containing protein [Verrucomicrobiota bacterium]